MCKPRQLNPNCGRFVPAIDTMAFGESHIAQFFVSRSQTAETAMEQLKQLMICISTIKPW